MQNDRMVKGGIVQILWSFVEYGTRIGENFTECSGRVMQKGIFVQPLQKRSFFVIIEGKKASMPCSTLRFSTAHG